MGRCLRISCVVIQLILITSVLNAQDSLDVRWVSGSLGSTARKVACAEIDNTVYAFVFKHGSIAVLDVSDPADPQKINDIGHPTTIGKGVMEDTLLYVPVSNYGLWIYNITDPLIMSRLGTCDTYNASGVAVNGNYAYIADADSGLAIIDVTQPSVPVKIGNIDLQSNCIDVVVNDTIAYVAAVTKISIVNVANPVNPVLISTWNPHGNESIRSLEHRDNYLHIANFNVGVWVVDVSDPQVPTSVDSLAISLAMDITVDSSYSFCACEDIGVTVINITDPYNIFIVDTIMTAGHALGVSCYSQLLFIADYFSTVVVDIMDPTNPTVIGSSNNLYDRSQGIAISGHYAYVAHRLDGLRVLDVTDINQPVEVGYCTTPSMANGVAVSDSLAFIADADSGLRIINISNPFNPYEIGFFDTPGFARDVVVESIYAYVSDGDMGLQIIDISDPTSPFFVGSYSPPPPPSVHARDIYKQGAYVYQTYDEGALRIIDVSNPYDPFETGCFRPQSGSNYVQVSAQYAYIAGLDYRFYVVDVTDPSAPAPIDSLLPQDFSYITGGLTVHSNYGFVGTIAPLATPLSIINIEDPYNIHIDGYYNWDNNWFPGDMDNSGYFIFITADFIGIQIFQYYGAPGIKDRQLSKLPSDNYLWLKVAPNPFNEKTVIQYNIEPECYLKTDERLQLSIYDAVGRLVKNFSIKDQRKNGKVVWNRVDDQGICLNRGVYFVKLQYGDLVKTTKLLFIK